MVPQQNKRENGKKSLVEYTLVTMETQPTMEMENFC